MSVIIESQPGDKLVCLESFSASPRGEPFSWKTSRTFKIGEHVRYVSHYRDEQYKDQPVGWMIVVKATDGREYAASQTFFLLRGAWRNLEHYIVRKILAKPLHLLLKPFRHLRKKLRAQGPQPGPQHSVPPKG